MPDETSQPKNDSDAENKLDDQPINAENDLIDELSATVDEVASTIELDEDNQSEDSETVDEPLSDEIAEIETEKSDDKDLSDDEFYAKYPDTEPQRPETFNQLIEDAISVGADVIEDSEISETVDKKDVTDLKNKPQQIKFDELNLSVEDSTDVITVINEADLEDSIDSDEASNDEIIRVDTAELNISSEAATEPISALSEEDLAALNKAKSGNDEDEDEEIVIRDFLNEDDGEDEVIPEYLKPPEPEWKLVARQMREERQARQRELLEKRRAEDNRVIAERQSKLDQREEQKRQQETEFGEKWQQQKSEKKQAVEDMMQRIRDEREQKLQERADMEEKELGRRLTYPKPSQSKSYPKPSEIKRMAREQPENETDVTDTKIPSPPIHPKPADNDLDSRVSRLSKPESSSDENEDDNSKDKED